MDRVSVPVVSVVVDIESAGRNGREIFRGHNVGKKLIALIFEDCLDTVTGGSR